MSGDSPAQPDQEKRRALLAKQRGRGDEFARAVGRAHRDVVGAPGGPHGAQQALQGLRAGLRRNPPGRAARRGVCCPRRAACRPPDWPRAPCASPHRRSARLPRPPGTAAGDAPPPGAASDTRAPWTAARSPAAAAGRPSAACCGRKRPPGPPVDLAGRVQHRHVGPSPREWFTMRQRGIPLAPESRSSASTLWRLSAVTVSTHGLPIHLSASVVGELVAAERHVANHAQFGIGHHERDIGRDGDELSRRVAIQFAKPLLGTAKLLHKPSFTWRSRKIRRSTHRQFTVASALQICSARSTAWGPSTAMASAPSAGGQLRLYHQDGAAHQNSNRAVARHVADRADCCLQFVQARLRCNRQSNHRKSMLAEHPQHFFVGRREFMPDVPARTPEKLRHHGDAKRVLFARTRREQNASIWSCHPPRRFEIPG